MASNSLKARIVLDNERTVGSVSRYLFGGFAEHMGRCVYGGLYDPESPLADEQGFRRDVREALQEMRISILRYPGGNMLSGYNWRDGIGPRAQRPRRRELAWQSIETNHFGTDEFLAYCRSANIEPMLGVNLGTGTIEEAAALVEYCNAPAGTINADLRVANGHRDPYNVKYWCLGNEMDGPWQIGQLEAPAYAKKALEAAKMMHWHDSSLKLIACGSSNTQMATYPEWDRVVLETCWDKVDYLAMHYYATNHEDDTASFLGLASHFEEHVDTLAGMMRYVKALRRSNHDVKLSWDEWNVWYKDRSGAGGWTEAPRLSEEVYNLEDALVVAQWMSVFLRRCDVLEIACIAQVANVISPLTTSRDGLLRHTTYYPFVLFGQNASGVSLEPLVKAPEVETNKYGALPALDVSATYDAELDAGAVFIVNRSLTDTIETEIAWQGIAPAQNTAIIQICGSDPKAINTFENPNNIVPQHLKSVPVQNGSISVKLPPMSFTVVKTAGYEG